LNVKLIDQANMYIEYR